MAPGPHGPSPRDAWAHHACHRPLRSTECRSPRPAEPRPSVPPSAYSWPGSPPPTLVARRELRAPAPRVVYLPPRKEPPEPAVAMPEPSTIRSTTFPPASSNPTHRFAVCSRHTPTPAGATRRSAPAEAGTAVADEQTFSRRLTTGSSARSTPGLFNAGPNLSGAPPATIARTGSPKSAPAPARSTADKAPALHRRDRPW